MCVDPDGSWVVRGRLQPEAGAMLMRAVEAAGDALYRVEREEQKKQGEPSTQNEPSAEDDLSERLRSCAPDPGTGATTPAQRRADAIGRIAERALAAGFEGGEGSVRAERYQVMLHVEPDTLAQDRESGRSEIDGVRICGESARRLTCDAAVVRVTERVETKEVDAAANAAHAAETASTLQTAMPRTDGNVTAVTSKLDFSPTPDTGSGGTMDAATACGCATYPAKVTAVTRKFGFSPAPGTTRVLDVGRRTRTIPPALRRSLHARDRGCRFPGCGCRFTEAHHIAHWADGGRTELTNLVLLCLRHHHVVHEGGMTVCLDRHGRVAFATPSGRWIFDAPLGGAAPSNAYEAEDLVRAAAAAPPLPPPPLPAAPPSSAPYPGADRWRRAIDVPWAIEARAREAFDGG